jgi:tetratricopeptide (TPR) repeat protein
MADVLRDLGDMQGALAAIDRGLDKAGEEEVPARLRAEVLRGRGTLLRRVGRVNEAVEAYAEAIAVFRKAGAPRLEARAKNALAFAMYVLGHFEDAVALGLESIKIDLSIGGRFQIAQTLSTVGRSYASLGDAERGLVYLHRARQAHERYGDQDARADTLLCTAEVLVEQLRFDEAQILVDDAGALTSVTESTYDRIHENILRALLARALDRSEDAVVFAFEARQAAEAQAYVAFHFYAMAIEAAARVDIGEHHTGILLATTALGAMETLQGSEYGLATRVLCCQALKQAQSRQARPMRRRALEYLDRLLQAIRDDEHRRLFTERPIVRSLLAPDDSADS